MNEISGIGGRNYINRKTMYDENDITQKFKKKNSQIRVTVPVIRLYQ